MTEGQRRKIDKESGPLKNLKSVKEREQEVLDGVPKDFREPLEKMIQKYRDVFQRLLLWNVPECSRPLVSFILASSNSMTTHQTSW